MLNTINDSDIGVRFGPFVIQIDLKKISVGIHLGSLVRLAKNGTNPGLFQIRFQYILALCGFVPFGANLTTCL